MHFYQCKNVNSETRKVTRKKTSRVICFRSPVLTMFVYRLLRQDEDTANGMKERSQIPQHLFFDYVSNGSWETTTSRYISK